MGVRVLAIHVPGIGLTVSRQSQVAQATKPSGPGHKAKWPRPQSQVAQAALASVGVDYGRFLSSEVSININ